MSALFFLVLAIFLFQVVRIRRQADKERAKLWDDYIDRHIPEEIDGTKG